jgi:predicted TPR repeat methyltransferase
MSSGQSRMGNVRTMYAQRRLKAIAARWDARADCWDQALEDPGCHLNEDDAYSRFTQVVKRIIAKRQKFCGIHGVIDVGCGTGLVLAEVVSSFAWGIGIDISPKMIRAARGKRIVKTKFLAGDCFDLPSLCSKAGAVLSRGVLVSHYGRNQGQAILVAARSALVRGGFLVFDFLNEEARTKYRHTPENKIWFSGTAMRLMARQAGFSRVKILGKPERRVLVLVAETL